MSYLEARVHTNIWPFLPYVLRPSLGLETFAIVAKAS